jgi:hypothetical protein
MIPTVGIGYAVQNPNTPYFLFLALALLCGFGGGNFASSMSNISFFFPRSEKGNALALNAGLGNLGVSVVQLVVPLIITVGVFGWFGGDPTLVKAPAGSAPMWLQNAGFIWVPFIASSAFVPRSAGRSAVALGYRLGIRPMGRGACHARRFRSDDGRSRGRSLFPRHQGSTERVLGLLCDVPAPVLRNGRG